jgi:hypothetical protein
VVPDIARPSRATTPYAGPSSRALTADAPESRHRPLDMALTGAAAGALVLDLAQRRTSTTLRVLGTGAPKAPVVTIGGLKTIPAAIASDEDTIAVTYTLGGRVILATAARGGTWRRRTLAGSSRAEPAQGAAAVALDGGEPVVAWTRRPRPPATARDLYALQGGKVRRLTATSGDDSAPLAAARPAGGVFLAWTAHVRGRRVPLLRVLG